MPTLDQHQSADYVKAVYLGDSGTGKTGSLVSLLAAGYQLKILDMDNGLDALVQYARATCPDKLTAVEYRTIRNEYRASRAGPVPKDGMFAFTEACKVMEEWSKISDPNTVFVLDSGSAFGRAAFEWSRAMNPGSKDPRQWYGTAGEGVESTIALLTSEGFRMNVLVITHVNYKELVADVNKGYPNFVGTAVGTKIAKYFNTMILAESSGAGKNTRRRIKTLPTGVIDLKVPVPSVEAEYPLETGLATLFTQLKGK